MYSMYSIYICIYIYIYIYIYNKSFLPTYLSFTLQEYSSEDNLPENVKP